MNPSLIHSLTTVISFVLFIGICWWAYSSHTKSRFDEAARIPFDDEEADIAASDANKG
ncbi:CcoQ/FixQ family Cbb3-type cytochrome c oxidase assembly chaperone [Niveibacterium umoris]|uniref:Cytochrome c oxidase cbb3-type subunit 4 n=1 Tax=Niveibacterium umoris TaxID=1193620 RepID=A0A840BHM8_9RHOO|nr:cbb3-type cytochrome c oxidase subunit 3 [Niveibacterium umoris]MBB4011102.1 cytochrome c oxidase cbb3-type subunit 4 [Niveibacterium umoris]